MNERKILIIVENLPVPFDTRVWQEATTLVKNGYTVSVICPKAKGYTETEEVIDGVYIFRHNLPTEGNGPAGYFTEYSTALKEEWKLAKYVYNKIGFQVIQGCNPPDDIYLVVKKFRKFGVKYVFDHHDLCPELFKAKFGDKWHLLYQSQLWLEKQTYKNCDFAFVTNESYKKIAIERGRMNPDNVMVLRSGPNLDRMRIMPPDSELKSGYKYMMGYLGVIGQQEGIEYILKAAEIIKKKRNDIIWMIIGGGPHLSAVQRLAHDMNIDDCVHFTGRVSDEEMLRVLNTADICVNSDCYNSMNDKSTMNKILEYMALAKPIVQFDLTEGRVSAAGSSLYAKNNDANDMADKILELIDNPQRRKEMGELGRQRILNELSWEHTSKALLEGYDKVFSSIE